MNEVSISDESIINIPYRNNVGESPFWNPDKNSWYWLDQAGDIYEYNPSKNQCIKTEIGQRLGSMVLSESGELVIAGMKSIFSIQGDTVNNIASLEHPHENMKFADGRCDRQGRFMVSTMCPDITQQNEWGSWYTVSANNIYKATSEHYIIPNGSAFNAEGNIFYFSETDTDRRQIYKCNYDIDDGIITDIKPFLNLSQDRSLGRPDGAAIDVDGCYWVCGLDEGVIMRITPNGKIDRILKTPMKKPTMCSFGGSDYKTLIVTSLCRGENDLLEDPNGGCVMLVDLGYQGIAEPRFKGV
ncbi:MAG: SMP-30/gluconolactonase/LRE family protein [Vibrio sp.]|uniref:SMP-30/gluconolactonase/LRE family protein n=1 Tax=Vibrio sp. TaxID=678 RepID=UPI003A8B47E5